MFKKVLMHVINKDKDSCHNDNIVGDFSEHELYIGFHWCEYIIVEMTEDKSEVWLDYYPR